MTKHHRPHEAAATQALPPVVASLMEPFEEFFTAPVWSRLLILIVGIVLSPGKRLGERGPARHGPRLGQRLRTLSLCAQSSALEQRPVARKLLGMIIGDFLPSGPVVIGLDDTIERRWGHKISARGVYRDPVRSSHGHFVKTSGPKLALRDGAPSRAVDAKALGTAVPDHPRSVRTLQPRPWASS